MLFILTGFMHNTQQIPGLNYPALTKSSFANAENVQKLSANEHFLCFNILKALYTKGFESGIPVDSKIRLLRIGI